VLRNLKRVTSSFLWTRAGAAQIRGDFTEWFERGFKIVHDLLSENIGIAKIVGFFSAFIFVKSDIDAGPLALSSEAKNSECPLFSLPKFRSPKKAERKVEVRSSH
jgi:hypothetical protein